MKNHLIYLLFPVNLFLTSCDNRELELTNLHHQKDSIDNALAVLDNQNPNSETETEKLIAGYSQIKQAILDYDNEADRIGYKKGSSDILITIDEKVEALRKTATINKEREEKESKREKLTAELFHSIQGNWERTFLNDNYTSGFVSSTKYYFRISGNHVAVLRSYSEALSGYELNEKPYEPYAQCEFSIETDFSFEQYAYDLKADCFGRKLAAKRDDNGSWSLFFYKEGSYYPCTKSDLSL